MLKRFTTSMLLLWVLLAILGAVTCFFIGDEALAAYSAIRIASASTLFALAAFTFTWRVTWLPKLQEAYEGDEQIDHVRELREQGRKAEPYGGFYRLAYALSVLTGLVAATGFVQLFLGMWKSPVAAGICMGATVAVFILFGYMLHALHGVESDRIKKLQAVANAKLQQPVATISH